MSGRRHVWRLSNKTIEFGSRPLVMGIVNVTPDSFSDGGNYADHASAIAHGLTLINEGADILDIGGESSRPGATPVPEGEQLRRVMPVVKELAKQSDVPISIDTWKAPVARACLEVGARIVNDITALAGDPAMPQLVRDCRAGAILMHMQGTPATMQQNPQYADVVLDIRRFFEDRLRLLADVDIAAEQTVLDPGIGFGKAREHNLQLVARLEEFQDLGRPVCLGVSRKGFLGRLLERPIEERLAGSLAAALYGQSRGAVQIVRVHDVVETRDAIRLFALLEGARLGTPDGSTL
jgi:dihydropteroate synthase